MQLRDQVGGLGVQLGLESLAQEGVIAVPLALAVDRGDQEVPVVQLLEPAGGGVATHDGVAQRPAHLVEDRRPDQEPALRSGQVVRGPRSGGSRSSAGCSPRRRCPPRPLRCRWPGRPGRARPASPRSADTRSAVSRSDSTTPAAASRRVASATDSARSSVPTSSRRPLDPHPGRGNRQLLARSQRERPPRRHAPGERGDGPTRLRAGERLDLVEHDGDGWSWHPHAPRQVLPAPRRRSVPAERRDLGQRHARAERRPPPPTTTSPGRRRSGRTTPTPPATHGAPPSAPAAPTSRNRVERGPR